MNKDANKFILLFLLQCLQLMENGPHGLRGLNAVPPVAEELVQEAESVTTHHQQMVGRNALVIAPRPSTAILKNVPVRVPNKIHGSLSKHPVVLPSNSSKMLLGLHLKKILKFCSIFWNVRCVDLQ